MYHPWVLIIERVMNNWSSKGAHMRDGKTYVRTVCPIRSLDFDTSVSADQSKQKYPWLPALGLWALRIMLGIIINGRMADVCKARDRWRLTARALDYRGWVYEAACSAFERNEKPLCVGIYIRRVDYYRHKIINHKDIKIKCINVLHLIKLSR